MSEEIMIQLMQDINREQIRFGACEIKLTWHDGRLQFYELITSKRCNVANTPNRPVKSGGNIR